MANGIVQLIGTFKCCEAGGSLVDFSAVTSNVTITETRQTITVPAVLSTAESDSAASEWSRSLAVTFHSTTAAATLHAVLRAAINTSTSLIDWEYIANDDAVSASNPRFSGQAMVVQLETGGEVGALRQQTITMPIKAGTYTAAAV
jgi:hypothetical protein